MAESFSNIYKNARIRAGLKREPAAEELNINVRTLDTYESIDGHPNDDVVKMMCKLYNNNFLAWEHIKLSPLGELLPELTKDSFQGATLRVLCDFKEVQKILDEIVAIAADGKLDASEKPVWFDNKNKLIQLAGSLITLLLSSKEGENE